MAQITQAAYDANKKANQYLKELQGIVTEEVLEKSYTKVYNDSSLDLMPQEFWDNYGQLTKQRQAYIERQSALEQAGRRARKKTGSQGKSFQGAGDLQAKIEKAERELAELRSEAETTTQEAVKPTEATPAELQGKSGKQLTGSIKEMVEQGLQESGLNQKEAKALLAEIEALGNAENDPIILKLKEERKAIGNKRDEATLKAKAEIDARIKTRKEERAALREKAKPIDSNLRQVLRTEWDGTSGIAKQMPVRVHAVSFC